MPTGLGHTEVMTLSGPAVPAAPGADEAHESLHPRVPDVVDPRVERSREQVLGATLQLLGEIGYRPRARCAIGW
jgi:hypothetical protein